MRKQVGQRRPGKPFPELMIAEGDLVEMLEGLVMNRGVI